jgi:tRNA modification GTPase
LAGAELAIVTPTPGTTRDRVSQMIQIEGVPVHVVDTAGLRHPDKTADEVERIGIDRTWQAIAQADAIVLLHDATRVGEPDYDRAEARIERDLAPRAREPGRVLHVYNKVDIAAAPADALAISALTGKGLARLREELLRRAGWHASPEGVFIARARHVHALERCAQHLVLAQRLAGDEHAALELLAEELRLAHQALGEITGSFTADDLLGEIFGRFCIGK